MTIDPGEARAPWQGRMTEEGTGCTVETLLAPHSTDPSTSARQRAPHRCLTLAACESRIFHGVNFSIGCSGASGMRAAGSVNASHQSSASPSDYRKHRSGKSQ